MIWRSRRQRWIAGERVFADCDILQNPDEIERHCACAGGARRIGRSDNDTDENDTDNSRRLAQGFDRTISTSSFDLKAVTSGLE
jgi:hypothetical protein